MQPLDLTSYYVTVISCAFLLLCLALFLFHAQTRKLVRAQPQEPEIIIDSVTQDYQMIYERIQHAATRSELAYLEALAESFEETHRSNHYVHEMYIDLLKEIQARYNVLYVVRQTA